MDEYLSSGTPAPLGGNAFTMSPYFGRQRLYNEPFFYKPVCDAATRIKMYRIIRRFRSFLFCVWLKFLC